MIRVEQGTQTCDIPLKQLSSKTPLGRSRSMSSCHHNEPGLAMEKICFVADEGKENLDISKTQQVGFNSQIHSVKNAYLLYLINCIHCNYKSFYILEPISPDNKDVYVEIEHKRIYNVEEPHTSLNKPLHSNECIYTYCTNTNPLNENSSKLDINPVSKPHSPDHTIKKGFASTKVPTANDSMTYGKHGSKYTVSSFLSLNIGLPKRELIDSNLPVLIGKQMDKNPRKDDHKISLYKLRLSNHQYIK